MTHFPYSLLRHTLLTRSGLTRAYGVALLLVLLWGAIRWATLLP
jgi:hypothetical protein